MVTISATNSATPSLQAALGRSRLEQARRVADQAEAQAQDLRAQADAQEQTAQQARQHSLSLEGLANDVPSATRTKSASAKAPADNSPTYIETLASVFQAATTLTELDLSATAKNKVTASLFEAAGSVWSNSQSSGQAIRHYGDQIAVTSGKASGSLLNATA